jgi:hypothetical protein
MGSIDDAFKSNLQSIRGLESDWSRQRFMDETGICGSGYAGRELSTERSLTQEASVYEGELEAILRALLAPPTR